MEVQLDFNTFQVLDHTHDITTLIYIPAICAATAKMKSYSSLLSKLLKKAHNQAYGTFFSSGFAQTV
jgi:hypothetical protein